jgi:hypothetical protein
MQRSFYSCNAQTARQLGSAIFITYFLGAYAELRKETISFVMSVRLSARHNSAHTGRIFTKFYIWVFFWNSGMKIQVSLNSDKNNGHYT